MDTNSILEIFRQALKGGVNRLGQQFSPFSEEERQANMNQEPNFPGYSTTAGADGPMDPAQIDAINRRNLAGFEIDPREGIAAQFAPRQVGTRRWATQRDWNNNPHTRLDVGPEMPMMGRQITAEEFGNGPYPQTEPYDAPFGDPVPPPPQRPTPRFPGVDDMRQHRGTGYTVPGAARQDIMAGHDAGRDYGYEGPGQYPQDVVDRVLIEEQMRRRNRTMPGSPVNY